MTSLKMHTAYSKPIGRKMLYTYRCTRSTVTCSLYVMPLIIMNKKFELMLTRRAKAYSSSGLVV